LAVATSEPEAVTKNLYEGMFLLDSGKFAANPEEVTQHVLDFLEKADAEVVAHRPWLDGRLAYEIEGKRRGVHYLIYFKLPGAGVTEITRRCKLSELVMRHLVIRHEQTLFDAMVQALNVGNESESEGEAKDGEAKEGTTAEAAAPAEGGDAVVATGDTE
jgi:small subunit ribosomal protein S6